MVVIDDRKQRGHGSQIMVRRLALQQLNNGAANAPDVRGRGGARELDDLGGHPVRGADDLGLLVGPGEGARADAKVGQLDGAILGGQDVGAFDVAVDDALVVQVLQALQDLGHVDADQVLGKLAVGFADGMQRAILAISGTTSAKDTDTKGGEEVDRLKDDVEAVCRLDEANIFHDIVMLPAGQRFLSAHRVRACSRTWRFRHQVLT